MGGWVSGFTKKLLGVGAAVAVVVAAIALYIGTWATSFPQEVAGASTGTAGSSTGTSLTLETVAAVGSTYSPAHPDWVSYLIQSHGQWVHSTDYMVPANTVIHMTIYQFDSASGLRNPFMAQPEGTVGGETLDGRAVAAIDPTTTSHTFAIPELGVFVPLPGISGTAKNPCADAPCGLSFDHRTISFSFRTGRRGRYHWQCFVPCGAGYINGNGGPMQTLGYMDGFLDVV